MKRKFQLSNTCTWPHGTQLPKLTESLKINAQKVIKTFSMLCSGLSCFVSLNDSKFILTKLSCSCAKALDYIVFLVTLCSALGCYNYIALFGNLLYDLPKNLHENKVCDRKVTQFFFIC